MISFFHVRIVKAVLLNTVIVALTISCTGLTTAPASIDAAAVKGMVFVVYRNSVTSDIADSDNQAIAAQVSANLKSWGYAVTDQTSPQVTHRLEGKVGQIKQSATPTGFSFSAGNSDPRALDFQKAKTIPVTCSLVSLENNELAASHTMEFSATSGWSGTALATTSETLIDWLSTVCLNHLKNLNINTAAPDQNKHTSKPSWAPQVLIEVETPAETPPEKSPETPQPSTTVAPAGNVRIETEPRKQMTIYNQGTPLILKFGRDRQGN